MLSAIWMVVYALKTDAKLQKISEIATYFFALVLLKCSFERNFFVAVFKNRPFQRSFRDSEKKPSPNLPPLGEDGRGLPLTCHDNIPKRIICIPKEIRKRQKGRKFYIIICFRKFWYFRVFSESKKKIFRNLKRKKGSVCFPLTLLSATPLTLGMAQTSLALFSLNRGVQRSMFNVQRLMSHATRCCQGGTQCGQHCNDNLYYCFPKIFFHDNDYLG